MPTSADTGTLVNSRASSVASSSLPSAVSDDNEDDDTVEVVKRPREATARDDVHEDLNCGICCDLLNDARQTDCCGALSCAQCITISLRGNDKCPYCRSPLTAAKLHVDRRMERLAAAAVRSCPHDGCCFTGKRDALATHVSNCPKRPATDVIAELRVRIAALETQRKHLFWALGQNLPHVDCAARYQQHLALRNLHVFNLGKKVRTFPTRGKPLLYSDRGDIHYTGGYLGQLRRLPATEMELGVSVSGTVAVTVRHREAQSTPTTGHVCLCTAVLAAVATRAITIPASPTHGEVTLASWVTVPELERRLYDGHLYFVIVASLEDIDVVQS